MSTPRSASVLPEYKPLEPRPLELDQDFHREVRFAVVMYGGVSLAVYINGVAQELFHMVRATAPGEADPLSGRFRFAADSKDLGGSAQVYRELGHALGARFVVDILSGTSAGGINAVYLAKALVGNKSLKGLRDLWVNEAELTRLLNDEGSSEGLPPGLLDSPPESVLNGRRFYRKLLDALHQIDDDAALPLPEPPPPDSTKPPYVDELDLLITATDFDGAKLKLKLSDQNILEPKYRKIFQFRYRNTADVAAVVDELGPDMNPMLAFAARCTASFPVAFAPFRLDDIEPVLAGCDKYRGFTYDPTRWKNFFEQYDAGYEKRYFVDGGYLDNKPFEGAIAAAAKRQRPLLPVERKLLYVEPHPDEYAPDGTRDRPPDAIENLEAVIGLPRVETVRAQIEEIAHRNRVVRRASMLTLGADDDLKRKKPPVRQTSANLWALDDLAQMIADYGIAYGGYHRLKVSRLTNWLAHCAEGEAAMGQAHASSAELRRLMSVWREGTYALYYTAADEKVVAPDWRRARADPNALQKLTGAELGERFPFKTPTQNRLLVDFDVFYRVRRVEFERLKVCEAMESPQKATEVLELGGVTDVKVVAEAAASWRAEQRALVEVLQKDLQVIHQRLLDVFRCASLEAEALATLQTLKADLERLKFPPLGDPAEVARSAEGAEIARRTDAALNGLRQRLRDEFIAVGSLYEKFFEQRPGDKPLVASLRAALAAIHGNFAEMDLVRFSVMETMGTGELEPMDVVRISAIDAKALGDRGVHKLAGVAIGHFGAFFDADWRKHDILWGRLDAAERIITTLAPAGTTRTKLDEWMVAAFRGIIREELAPHTIDEALVKRLADQLAARVGEPGEREKASAAAMHAAYDAGWAQIQQEPGGTDARHKIADYLEKRVINAPLALPRQLKLLDRTTTIIRDLVGGLAKRRGQSEKVLVKSLLRLLAVVALVVELAVPGLKSTLLRRLCGFLIFAGGTFAAVNTLLGRWSEVGISVLVALAGVLLFLAASSVPTVLGTIAAKKRPEPRLKLGVKRWLLAGVLLAGSVATFPAALQRASFPPWDAAAQHQGLTMLDLVFARDATRAARVVGQWTHAGVMDRVRLAVKWDYAFIAVYTVGLACLALLLGAGFRAAKTNPPLRLDRRAAWAVVVAGLCDGVENWLLLWTLDQSAPPWASWVTFGFASVKFGLAILAVVYVAVLVPMLLVAVARRPAYRYYRWARYKLRLSSPALRRFPRALHARARPPKPE